MKKTPNQTALTIPSLKSPTSLSSDPRLPSSILWRRLLRLDFYPIEPILQSEDSLQELQDAFTVRGSWPDDTQMLDLLMEEKESEQEQHLINMLQKRPP